MPKSPVRPAALALFAAAGEKGLNMPEVANWMPRFQGAALLSALRLAVDGQLEEHRGRLRLVPEALNRFRREQAEKAEAREREIAATKAAFEERRRREEAVAAAAAALVKAERAAAR